MDSTRDVKKRVQMGWGACGRRTAARVGGKVYKVAVGPGVLSHLETVTLAKRKEAKQEVAELKMLRISFGWVLIQSLGFNILHICTCS